MIFLTFNFATIFLTNIANKVPKRKLNPQNNGFKVFTPKLPKYVYANQESNEINP